jgi:hypothetical protein
VNRIEGKVAAFVGSREIAINVGRKDGVRPGMIFDVLSSVSDDVKDPDTGETLGQLSHEIARVQAIDVQDRMTICASYVRTGPESLAEALEALLESRTSARRSRTSLPWATPSVSTATDEYVRVGDRVRQVAEI